MIANPAGPAADMNRAEPEWDQHRVASAIWPYISDRSFDMAQYIRPSNLEVASTDTDVGWTNQSAMRDLHRMQRPIKITLPEVEKAVE